MNPFEAYHKSNVGVLSPLAAAMLGYFGTKKFGRGITRMALKGKPLPLQKSVMEAYRNVGDKKLGMLAGGLLGGAEAVRTASKYNPNLRDFLNKLTDVDYKTDVYNDLLEPTQKNAQDDTLLDDKVVPVKDMIETVNMDSFINTYDKLKTNTLLYKSDDRKEGIVSGKDIARTAIRAGAGFVPGYAFGKVITGLAGFPKEVRNRLATTGGIAGALYNTGIFQEKF